MKKLTLLLFWFFLACTAQAQLIIDNAKKEVTKTSGATTTVIAGTAAPAPLGWHSKLVVTSNAANYVGITADYLVLTDGTPSAIGDAKTTGNVSVSAYITTSGVNGLDTGVAAASTWYAAWVIAKADGTVSCLLSASFTAPTLPSGYIYKARVGSAYVKSIGPVALYRFIQRGRMWQFTSEVNEGLSVLNGGTLTSLSVINISAACPTTAVAVWGDFRASASKRTSLSSNNSKTILTCSSGNQDTITLFYLVLETAQEMFYMVESAGSASIEVAGFEDY